MLHVSPCLRCTVLLAACSATDQQSIQQSADQNVLAATVGRPYAEVAATQAMTTEGLFGQDKAYGVLVSQSRLDNGDTVYKHLERTVASQSTTDFFGITGNVEQRIDYRLFYFRVGTDGIIKDFANGVVTGENVNCVTYISGLINNCGDAQVMSSDVAVWDAAVITSSGQPLSSWQ